MTALRCHTGGGRHQTSPASLRGGASQDKTKKDQATQDKTNQTEVTHNAQRKHLGPVRLSTSLVQSKASDEPPTLAMLSLSWLRMISSLSRSGSLRTLPSMPSSSRRVSPACSTGWDLARCTKKQTRRTSYFI